jgi:hypothetical protein
MRYIAASGALLLLISGCFSYAPYEQPAPKPGDHVTADLTPAGSEHMARWVGPDVGSVNGEVLSADGGDMLLSVRSTTNYRDITTSWQGEQVRIPLGDVDRMLTKKFSIGRTLLATGAAVGVALLGAKVLTGGSSGATTGSSGGGPAPQ